MSPYSNQSSALAAAAAAAETGCAEVSTTVDKVDNELMMNLPSLRFVDHLAFDAWKESIDWLFSPKGGGGRGERGTAGRQRRRGRQEGQQR